MMSFFSSIEQKLDNICSSGKYYYDPQEEYQRGTIEAYFKNKNTGIIKTTPVDEKLIAVLQIRVSLILQ